MVAIYLVGATTEYDRESPIYGSFGPSGGGRECTVGTSRVTNVVGPHTPIGAIVFDTANILQNRTNKKVRLLILPICHSGWEICPYKCYYRGSSTLKAW